MPCSLRSRTLIMRILRISGKARRATVNDFYKSPSSSKLKFAKGTEGKRQKPNIEYSMFGFCSVMPPVGVEPTLPKKLDFESSASANSATEAWRFYTSIEAEQNYKAKSDRCQQISPVKEARQQENLEERAGNRVLDFRLFLCDTLSLFAKVERVQQVVGIGITG